MFTGSCLKYGHSCWGKMNVKKNNMNILNVNLLGAHGKRANLPPNLGSSIKGDNDIDRWEVFKFSVGVSTMIIFM